MQRKNALHAGAEADPAHSEGRAGCAALLGNHHTFKSLNAFLDLFAFAFLQAHVHFDGVARTKFRQIFAQLRFMEFTDDQIHVRYSLQTHSDGASSSKTNHYYSQICAAILPSIALCL